MITDPICEFSENRIYRYTLWRETGCLGGGGYVQFILLNPSDANEERNDPTVRRCVAYGLRWQFALVCITNLFAYVSPDPDDLLRVRDPIGPLNDERLISISKNARMIVAAWGIHGKFFGRHDKVKDLFAGRLHCFGTNKDGTPKHPLYLRKEADIVVFE